MVLPPHVSHIEADQQVVEVHDNMDKGIQQDNNPWAGALEIESHVGDCHGGDVVVCVDEAQVTPPQHNEQSVEEFQKLATRSAVEGEYEIDLITPR